MTIAAQRRPAVLTWAVTLARLVLGGVWIAAGDTFAQCVQDERYAGWTKSVAEAASRAGISGTPTVLVNGATVERTPEGIRAAVGAG